MCSTIKILHSLILYFIMHKIAVLSKIKSNSDVIDYFKELPFYNKPIEKPKRLTNIDQLVELHFYEQLDVIKTDQAFSGYAMSYIVEINEKKRSSCTTKSK